MRYFRRRVSQSSPAGAASFGCGGCSECTVLMGGVQAPAFSMMQKMCHCHIKGHFRAAAPLQRACGTRTGLGSLETVSFPLYSCWHHKAEVALPSTLKEQTKFPNPSLGSSSILLASVLCGGCWRWWPDETRSDRNPSPLQDPPHAVWSRIRFPVCLGGFWKGGISFSAQHCKTA